MTTKVIIPFPEELNKDRVVTINKVSLSGALSPCDVPTEVQISTDKNNQGYQLHFQYPGPVERRLIKKYDGNKVQLFIGSQTNASVL